MEDKLSKEQAEKILAEKENAGHVKFEQPVKPLEPAISPTPVDFGLGISEAAKKAAAPAPDPLLAGQDGWKMIPLQNLPSMGMFYPAGTEVAIKAATVTEIRHFSQIDELDPLDMDDKLNVVMDKCSKIKLPDKLGSYRDFKEEDRFFLIFAIRDLTFINGENKLFINIKCGTRCLGDGSFSEKMELRNGNFECYKLDDSIMRFYSADDQCFILPLKDGPLKLYIPTLGVTTFIKNFVRGAQARGDYYDKTFVKVASFLFNDWRLLNDDRYIKAQQESMSWGVNRLSAVLQAVEKIRFGIKTDVTRQCNKCGAEVTAPLTFPGGVKSIFLISDPLGGL